jgi:hypothetical protein
MFPEAFPHSHSPNSFALVIHVVLDPKELADAALQDPEADPQSRALVSLTCTLLHGSGHPEFLTEERLAGMAPLLRTVLAQDEPAASRDLQALWEFVDECFDAESPVRTIFVDVVAERPNERFASIIAGSVLAFGPH